MNSPSTSWHVRGLSVGTCTCTSSKLAGKTQWNSLDSLQRHRMMSEPSPASRSFPTPKVHKTRHRQCREHAQALPSRTLRQYEGSACQAARLLGSRFLKALIVSSCLPMHLRDTSRRVHRIRRNCFCFGADCVVIVCLVLDVHAVHLQCPTQWFH